MFYCVSISHICGELYVLCYGVVSVLSTNGNGVSDVT